jgi:hypothetical protein
VSAGDVAEWVLSGGLLVGIGATAVRAAVSTEHRAQLRVLTRLRAKRAERAAVAASISDPVFSPEAIRASVMGMLETAQKVWNGTDGRKPRRPSEIDLIRGWAMARRQQIGAGLRIAGKPKIDVLRVVNRELEAEDRAIVRVRLRIHRDPKALQSEPGDGTFMALRVVPIEERWTLARRGDRWSLASISGDPISEALISAPLIESPAEDEERLHEAGLRELAGRDAPSTSSLAELIDGDAPAADRLRELSVLDDRFSPQLLEATLHHVLEAWEALTDGSQRPLEQVAGGPAMQALMYADRRRGRRLIRDPELAGWVVLDVDASAKPPWVRVRLELKAAVFGYDGSRSFGNDRQRRKHTLVWTLELVAAEGQDASWRLAASADA